MATFWRGILAMVAMTGVACQLKVEDPDAPNTDVLEAVYDRPPGLFAAANGKQLKEALDKRLTLLRSTGSFGSPLGLLDSVSAHEGVLEHGDEVDDMGASRLLAVVDVTHVCRGPEGDDIVDPGRFGTISMTLKGGLRGIYPVAWGEFDACSDHTLAGPVSIDGTYSMTVRKRTTGRDVLILFQGTIRSPLLNFNGALDVRVLSNGSPEVRVSGADGDVVLSVDSTGQLIARDRTGLWTCDVVKLECVNPTTGERKAYE